MLAAVNPSSCLPSPATTDPLARRISYLVSCHLVTDALHAASTYDDSGLEDELVSRLCRCRTTDDPAAIGLINVYLEQSVF